MPFDLAFGDFVPALAVVGVFLLFEHIGYERCARLIGPAVLVAAVHYFHWRISGTMDGPGIDDADRLFIRAFLGVELLGYFDGIVLLFVMARRRDNTPVADAFVRAVAEGRIRRADLPAVDVFIPTYDEPLDVLRRAILAAKAMDWPNFRVVVLDDKRRPWLREYCRSVGVAYETRPDNRDAKAGNLNHALARSSAPFFAVFDADFAPRRDFLMRTMGVMLSDPRIGIVQAPQRFFNPDPLQHNLGLQGRIPDEQRFFFEAVQPCRDAWDAAFCCGSNSVTRREALRSVGDRLPGGSITEDLHLTLVLLRKGWITRYLDEPLALGLAPESVPAFFVQRERWMRGAMQCLWLRTGPFGPGLRPLHRLLFLPTHWAITPLVTGMSLFAPILFLWFGLIPIANVNAPLVVYHQVPLLLAMILGLTWLSRGTFHFAIASIVNCFLFFRLFPAVLHALVAPFRTGFSVTPKGDAARASAGDRTVAALALAIAGMLFGGLLINLVPATRVVPLEGMAPIVAFWAVVIGLFLVLIANVALQRPMLRSEERFLMNEVCTICCERPSDESGVVRLEPAELVDLSLSGARLSLRTPPPPVGTSLLLSIDGVPTVRAEVARRIGERDVGVRFVAPSEAVREGIVQRTLSEGRQPAIAMRVQRGVLAALAKTLLSGGTPTVPAARVKDAAADEAPSVRTEAAAWSRTA